MSFRSNRGLVEGYRSGLEEIVGEQLKQQGLPVEYEMVTLEYTQPAKVRRYTPDFILPNGIIIETKGRFVSDDRVKHRLIAAEHPDLDIRFVFSNPRTRISKTSRTTYALWCERYGFQYAAKFIPKLWLMEAVKPERVAAIERAKKK